jgi:deoxyribonuclease V
MRDYDLIACLDVDYRNPIAVAAGVWFQNWSAATAECEATAVFNEVAEYHPGEFYHRELPCLIEVLARGPVPQVAVIDGYVWLGEGRLGLGAHLYEALGRKTAVIGVAKTQFLSATESVPVCRGKSRAPLYVTSAGVDVSQAANWVAGMHGPFRVPTLLKRVDRLARTAVAIK